LFVIPEGNLLFVVVEGLSEKGHAVQPGSCFVTGHDFSRAADARKTNWALAPALSPVLGE
jgi:hypothetical protein